MGTIILQKDRINAVDSVAVLKLSILVDSQKSAQIKLTLSNTIKVHF